VARPERVDCEARTGLGRIPLGDAGAEAAAWFEGVLGTPCRLTAIAEGYTRRIVLGDDLFDQEVSLADAAPVLLVNAASYRHLLQNASEPFGIERFRPNVVIEGCDPWDEDAWEQVAIGAAEAHVVLPWPRCAIPQIDQHTGQRHREPALVLKRLRWCSDASGLREELRGLVAGNGLFGAAASIGPQGASICVGDPVEVLRRREPLVLLAAAPGRHAV
jgi:uncharacterized protein